jgi:hypothetical protein
MWRKNANGDSVRPADVDRDSSRKYVYVRKDFQLIPESGDIPEHWEWMEAKIPKDAVMIYDEHNEALDDVYAALTELAEIIAGE